MWITYKMHHEPVTLSFCLMTCSVNTLPVHAYIDGWENSLTMLRGKASSSWPRSHNAERVSWLLLTAWEHRVGVQNCECLLPAGLPLNSASSWQGLTQLCSSLASGTINKDITIWIPWRGEQRKGSHLAATAGLIGFNWPFFPSYLFSINKPTADISTAIM